MLHLTLLLVCIGWLGRAQLLPRWESTAPRLYLVHDLALANAWLLAATLLPLKTRVGDNRVSSDGLQLCTIAFSPRKKVEAWHAEYFFREGMQRVRKKQFAEAIHWFQSGLERYPQSLANRLWLGIALLRTRAFGQARDQFHLAAGLPDLQPAWRAVVADAIATAILYDLPVPARDMTSADQPPTEPITNDAAATRAAAIQEAKDYCGKALKEILQVPVLARLSFYGTWGSLLVEEGDAVEGTRILEGIVEEGENPEIDAICCCYLALAAARRGHLEKARRRLIQAEKLNADCLSLERVREEWPELRA